MNRLTVRCAVLSAVMMLSCPGATWAGETAAKTSGLPKLWLYRDDNGNAFRLQVGTQLQMEFKSKDLGDGGDNVNTTVMKLRSVRPIFTGTMLDGRLGMKLQVNIVPGAFELLDVIFDYKFEPDFQLRYGVFKMPFTHYRMASKLRLHQIDWAVTSKYFGAERQWGFALHNGFEKPPRWGYVLAVGTGENSRASHGKGVALAYGEELPNPSDLSGEGGSPEFHPEVFGHLSLNSDGMDISSETDAERTGLRYSLALSGAWDMDPEPYIDFSYRVAPEVLIKYRGLCLTGIAYAGWAEIGSCGADHMAMTGGLIHAAYRFNERWELSGRYATVKMARRLIDDARDRSGREDLGLKEEIWDLKEDYALVLNVYLIEHLLKLQNGIQLLKPKIDRTDLLVQSQFQLWF